MLIKQLPPFSLLKGGHIYSTPAAVILLLGFFMSFSQGLFGQSQSTDPDRSADLYSWSLPDYSTYNDSLQSVWSDESRSDSLRMESFEKFYTHYMPRDQEKAIAYCDNFIASFSKGANDLIKAEVHALKSDSYMAMARYDKAKELNEMGLELLQNSGIEDKRLESLLVGNLAYVNSNLGNSKESEEQYERSYQLADASGDVRWQAKVNNRRGHMLMRQGDMEGGLEMVYNSLKTAQELGLHHVEIRSLVVLGHTFVGQDEFEKAIEHYDRVIELCQMHHFESNIPLTVAYKINPLISLDRADEAIREGQWALEYSKNFNEYLNPYVLNQLLGMACLAKGDKAKGEAYLNSSEQVITSLDVTLPASRFLSLGFLRLQTGDLKKAEKFFLMAMEIAEKDDDILAKIDGTEGLYLVYKQTGRLEEALETFEKHKGLQEAYLNEENESALLSSELKFEYEKKAYADSLAFASEKAIQANQLKSEKNTRYALIGGLLLALFLGGVLYNRFKLTQKQKAIIEQNAEELKEMDRVKNSFFANISHEFRTPLSVITGMADMMKADPEKWSASGLNMIRNNGENLLNLVNQILDLQKLEKDEMILNMVQTDVIPFLSKSSMLFQPLAIKKGLTYSVEKKVDSLIMDFDAERLTRILSNLIGNAIKFTQEGSVTINLSKTDLNGEDALEIAVQDSGIGISEADRQKIFERFYQADNEQTKVGQGTGIGLQLVSEIVRLAEGDIRVESSPGDGSTFLVRLPVRRAAIEMEVEDLPILAMHGVQTDSDSPTVALEPISDAPRLLVIEDNPDLVQLLVAQLGSDYEIHVANDGAEGVDMALTLVPDLIISDVMMPHKDGFQVVDELKNNGLTSHIPILLLTAKDDVESRLIGLKRGADDYVAKPFNAEELALRLSNMLTLRNRFADRYASGVKVEAPSQEPDLEQEDEFIIKLQQTLDDNLTDGDFGIKELCKELIIGRTQLHNKIKALTGHSTSIYIKKVRLSRAYHLLKDPELNISEIAYTVGFSDPKYFSRSFSAEYGKPPTEVRDELGVG